MADDDNVVRLAELRQNDTGEDALALVFAAAHADDLRYVAKRFQWLSWDGLCWTEDSTLHTFDRVRDLCREASAKATATTVAAVEKLAKADRRLAATAAQWDAAPWLFNARED
jgi:putative DNA primase/helicase